VVAFGAPFLPTLKPKIPIALDLINLKPGQTLLELGSGDGRVLKAAAQRGLKAVGYELNPLLVVYSKILTFRYRKQVRVVWGNYWKKQWPPAEGIFVFLLRPYMEKLDKKITTECRKGTKLVSFAFTIDSHKPAKVKDGVYLYTY
jgi:16S rRNA A1518/A1519 N6-dimethyltransferase RsmA/KsgA/DIM1 with predicted DNA glycosylase/AP lyase activity